MFTSLKNRIREETGSDVSKIAPVSTGGSQKTVLSKGRHSRQGSTSSIGSSSLDGLREDISVSPVPYDNCIDGSPDDWKGDLRQIEKKEEEWKRKLVKLELDWKKKLEEKEKELIKQLEIKGSENDALEKAKTELQETVSQMKEYRQKYFAFQEEKDQLEGFQSQEIAKVKHLLLSKEQEIAEHLNSLKESRAQITALRSEVNRLRRFEEEVSHVQDEMEALRHSTEQQHSSLRSELAQSEENVRHLKDRVAVLERRTSADCVALGAPLSIDERVQGLLGERTLLERRLEEAHLHLADIKSSWSSKITSLETQVGRLCRQAAEEKAERRRAEEECSRLEERVQQLENELSNAVQSLSESDSTHQENERLRHDLDEAFKNKEEACLTLSENQILAEERIRILTEELERERTNNSALQVSSETERRKLKDELVETQKAGNVAVENLHHQIADLHSQLEVERVKSAEILISLDRERCERDSTMMRNAEISQQVELSKLQLRTQESEMTELQSRIDVLEMIVLSKEKELETERKAQGTASLREEELRETVAELESSLVEKNKNIKQLQQRLGDMKKTLQRELKLPSGGYGAETFSGGSGLTLEDTNAAVLAPSSSHQVSQRRLKQQAETSSNTIDYNNVNFQYLKHVLIKFLTSREYEAKHLTRAVATLLHFSPEEEQLLHETLEWKMSWFGSRPNLGFGQTAKTINPS